MTHFVFYALSHAVSFFVFAVVVIRKYFNVYFAEKKIVSFLVLLFHILSFLFTDQPVVQVDAALVA